MSGTTLYLALRTDVGFENVKSFVDSQEYGGFAVREGAGTDNPHVHWLLVCGAKSVKAVRCKLLRAAPELSGNGKYSLTEVADLDKYVRYLCKGDASHSAPDVVWRNSVEYTEERLTEAHEAYWEENRRLKKKRTHGSMIDAVVDAAKEDNIGWNDRQALAKLYIRMLGERGKPINLHAVRSNLNAVQFALCPNTEILDSLAAGVE